MKDIIVFLNSERGINVVRKLKIFGHEILKCIIPINKKYDYVQREIKSIKVECLRIKDVNKKDIIKRLKKLNPKLFLVAGYSTILKNEVIKIPTKGTLNLHAGRLPYYRGGSPLNWQLINGEKKATISLIKINQKIDAGKILQERDILINKFTDINDLHSQANKLFPELVNSVIDKIENTKGRIQNEKKAVYWHQRNDDDGYIDFKKIDTLQISRIVRALTKPYPGAWANLKKKRVRIFKIEIPKFDLRGTPGRILFIQKQGPYVICNDRAILIKDYKIESDRHMKLKHGQFLK